MRTLIPTSTVLVTALLLSGCFGSKRDVSQYVDRAQQLLKDGRADKAQVELEDALRLNPLDVQANLALAKIEDQQGDLASALPHYLRAAAPDAHLVEPQLRLVQILLESNRYADASGRINTTLGSFPGNADALALRADLNERQGQVEQALTDANAAILKSPNNARALSVLAMLKLRNKDSQAALAIVDRGLKASPTDLRLLQVQAATLLTLNQPDKAVEALKTIVRTDPRNVAIQTALAEIEAGNGRRDDALANFRAAVDANPADQDLQLAFVAFLAKEAKDGDVQSYLRSLIANNVSTNTYDLVLAEYLHSRGQLDEAKTVLEQAAKRLKQGKPFLDVEVALAKVDASLGHIDLADSGLSSVLVADPDNPEALLFQAILATQNNRDAAAIKDLLQLVKADPVNARAFEVLAQAYLATGERKLAVEAMQRAVAVAPGEQAAQLKLAAFLQAAGQIQSVRELMSRLTLENPTDVKVWSANAQLGIERKDWQTASLSVARLRDLQGGASLSQALQGEILAGQGDPAGAMRALQTGIASDANVTPAVIRTYAGVAASTGKAADAAAFLSQKTDKLSGDAKRVAALLVMTLWGDAGQPDQAYAAFQTAAAAFPQDAELYQSGVEILLKEGKLDEAKHAVAMGLAVNAPRTQLLLLRGAVEEQAGNLKGALESYGQAVASNPLSLQASNNYASLLADQDPTNKSALEEARKRLVGGEQTNIASVLDTIAWVDYRLGRLDEAKQLLLRINAGQSTKPQFRFHLAAVYLASGDKQQGDALLQTVKGLTFTGSDEMRKLSET